MYFFSLKAFRKFWPLNVNNVILGCTGARLSTKLIFWFVTGWNCLRFWLLVVRYAIVGVWHLVSSLPYAFCSPNALMLDLLLWIKIVCFHNHHPNVDFFCLRRAEIWRQARLWLTCPRRMLAAVASPLLHRVPSLVQWKQDYHIVFNQSSHGQREARKLDGCHHTNSRVKKQCVAQKSTKKRTGDVGAPKLVHACLAHSDFLRSHNHLPRCPPECWQWKQWALFFVTLFHPKRRLGLPHALGLSWKTLSFQLDIALKCLVSQWKTAVCKLKAQGAMTKLLLSLLLWFLSLRGNTGAAPHSCFIINEVPGSKSEAAIQELKAPFEMTMLLLSMLLWIQLICPLEMSFEIGSSSNAPCQVTQACHEVPGFWVGNCIPWIEGTTCNDKCWKLNQIHTFTPVPAASAAYVALTL